jgi:hypothetical protein
MNFTRIDIASLYTPSCLGTLIKELANLDRSPVALVVL